MNEVDFLGQNAISNLALSPSNEWLEILELLQRGVKNKNVLCPTPLETIRASRTIEWLGIPLITCWLSLEGLLMYEQMQHGRKFRYNDELDRSRAATAFHVGNCFITDQKMMTMMKQLGADDSNYFDFKVFSIGEPKNIITYLKEIC
jgi:hypothetical protein